MRANFSDQDIRTVVNAGIQEGRPAKGLKLSDGSFVYWGVDGFGGPQHNEVLRWLDNTKGHVGPVEYLSIDREGNVENYNDNTWRFE
jgi:hypothetical protein